ncbi:MAG: MerR family transcriptional regulator [Alphaproteobacteria bacterium]|nr:MerR family transcriptional regulator [Alphaproteobacteria bacterium]
MIERRFTLTEVSIITEIPKKKIQEWKSIKFWSPESNAKISRKYSRDDILSLATFNDLLQVGMSLGLADEVKCTALAYRTDKQPLVLLSRGIGVQVDMEAIEKRINHSLDLFFQRHS